MGPVSGQNRTWYCVCTVELGAAGCPLRLLNECGVSPAREMECAMKAIWLAMLVMVMGVAVVGCKVDGDVDDDGAKLEVEVGD